ncbi:MAG: ABC transporter ATP-binding protein [Syntrophobacteraceae bacterium]
MSGMLEVRNLTKRFGGLVANDSISFEAAKGELLGIIGPNGAGKTTLFNCIAGVHRIDAGSIFFKGRDITRLSSHQIARLGLTRTFQVYAASGDLTVKENVMVGCFMNTRSRSKASVQAERILEGLQIGRLAGSLVNELTIAAQKRVVMATAIATQPKMLLLDEVAAGLVPQEVEEISALIRLIHDTMGITVILIEHMMEMVTKLCTQVIVLDYGRKIAEGAPEAVLAAPDVIKAYLGEKYAREYAERVKKCPEPSLK